MAAGRAAGHFWQHSQGYYGWGLLRFWLALSEVIVAAGRQGASRCSSVGLLWLRGALPVAPGKASIDYWGRFSEIQVAGG